MKIRTSAILAPSPKIIWWKCFSVKFLILIPKCCINFAIRKNLAALAIKTEQIKGKKATLQNPADKVTILKGKGRKLDIKTAKLS